MKKYTLYWRTGKAQVIEARKGLEPHEAFAMAGYSAGAIHSLDFFSWRHHRRLGMEPGNKVVG